jgi:hypothetical protein
MRAQVIAALIVLLPTSAGAADPTLGCRIAVKPGPDRLVLEAITQSAQATSGRYTFRVSRNGPGGSSQSLQSGEFSLSEGDEQVLATVVLAPDNEPTAHLSLEWNGGQKTCASR